MASSDDHLIEPADIFEGRISSKLAEGAPKVVVGDDGIEYWTLDDELIPKTGADASQSWEHQYWTLDPCNYDELIRGGWDTADRLADMDVGGIAASVTFPSQIFGFAGRRLSEMKDKELGLALVRAYNDWLIEEWAAAAPDRLIPCQLPWLVDAADGARELERNAERGFKAVSFSENPERHGFPSIHSDHWTPMLAACADTGTVLNLHVGSSSATRIPSLDSPVEVRAALFPINSFEVTVDWVYSQIPARFPELKIVLSEGGLGWVPMLIDRLKYNMRRWKDSALFTSWSGDLSPIDVMRRNFYFTVLHDPLALEHRHEIGIDHILFETDYPHADSTWPDCQAVVEDQIAGFTPEEIEKFTFGNTADIYRLDRERLKKLVPVDPEPEPA